IPSHMLKKSHISNAKISIQMTNIWYWAANSQGLDPEAWSGTSLSTSRGSSDPATYTLGLSLTF
ncbi:MAG: TonB-dependent receptor plug, partial [Bacteroidetes bacterium]|nr:TonB-dependent receptor plug [Bacteroidota bacterium]